MNKLLTYLGLDGLLHILCSIILTSILGLFLLIWIAAVITLVIGLLKEFVWDLAMKKGTFLFKDILCDIIGILIGLL